MQQLLRGPSPDRVGKHQRRVRQALIALGWKAEGISRRT
jgi:hypothetical protein